MNANATDRTGAAAIVERANGTRAPAATPTRGRKGRAKPAAARSPRRVRRPDHLYRWATGGVVLMAVMSALLNGYANAQHAAVAWAGWALGVAIPAVVLLLGRVAGLVYRRGLRRPALAVGAVGVGLLFLLVLHSAHSIALLTGSSVWPAALMAVAIDCGLVACELAALAGE